MNVYLEIVIRSVIAFFVLFLIAEMLGVKHISQLSFFDYIVGITIGSIAGAMCMDETISIWHGLIGLLAFALLSFIISTINRKTIIGRRVFTGNPTLLIEKGQVLYKHLKRSQLNVDDLLRELRSNGYYNIADVEYAILETNGQLSVLSKTAKMPVTVENMGLSLPQQGLNANVIIDKKIMHGNLTAMNKDVAWLMKQLENQKYQLEDIVLATLDMDGALSIYPINNDTRHRTLFQ